MHGHGPGRAEAHPTLVPDDVHRRRWAIVAVLSLSLLITAIDHTIVNVALPRMVTDLDASTSELQWMVDAYTVVFAGLLLTAGTLGDRFGRKGALLTGLGVFLVGSVLAATTDSADLVIAARAVMGVGGALIMPSTLSILTNAFRDPAERARAVAAWAGVAGIGVALGPITGGYLLRSFSWSSVFWVNVPLVALAAVLCWAIVPRSAATERRTLDPVGAALSIVALVALVYAVIEAPAHGWASGRTLATFAIAAAGLAAFTAWERRQREPMLDVGVFTNPGFSAPSVAITLTFFAMAGAVFLITQYLQFVLGHSPLRAGAGILPAAFALFAASPLSAHFAGRIGARATITIGMLVAAVGLGLQAALTDGSSYLPVGAGQTLLGLGIGLGMAPATNSIMNSLPPDRAGVGSAVNDTTREVGSALGVAIVGSAAASSYTGRVTEALDGPGVPPAVTAAAADNVGAALHVGVDGPAGAQIAQIARAAFVDAFQVGLAVAAGVAVGAAVLAFLAVPKGRDTAHPDPMPTDALAGHPAQVAR